MAKIFIQDITLLDCAILSFYQIPCGKSWTVDATLEGDKDSEGVLFDFSSLKKNLKQIIDQKFDHKLFLDSTKIKEKNHLSLSAYGPENRFFINTYPSAVREMKQWNQDISSEIEQEIEKEIKDSMPENISSVKISLRSPEQKTQFHFTHCLPNHYGNCQRFHGHSSCICVYKNDLLDLEKSLSISKILDNKYFIRKIYTELIENDLMRISYSGSQGSVDLTMPSDHVILLDQECTIENIAEHIHTNFCGSDPQTFVRIYEGLCKGAMYP